MKRKGDLKRSVKKVASKARAKRAAKNIMEATDRVMERQIKRINKSLKEADNKQAPKTKKPVTKEDNFRRLQDWLDKHTPKKNKK